MPKVTVDGKEVEVQNGMTVLQACELAGAEIPRFCYHERLSIAGNCRMCLVKLEKAPKPVASCAQPIADGMVIHTNTPEVKKMREGVMEFLLINHPLDCPICDQGGECDLQDQAITYGKGYSRYKDEKRCVDDKNMGPLVKTQMTRCIHCTRCVRFIEDVAGTNELGAVNRGEDMEITSYIEKSLKSELQGNIIDLCPVGALTSKPYAFKARSWELEHTETVDVMDAVGSSIRVDNKGREVMRVLPRLNEDINEEWISDKTRFSYDGLKYQRLDAPMVRINGKLAPVAWEEAYEAVSNKLLRTKPENVGAIAGDLTDVETMLSMKEMMTAIGSNNYDCRAEGSNIENSDRSQYIFNTSIAGIEKSDFCLIVGSNPRHEATILNARIRKATLNNMKVALVGEGVDLTYSYKHLGENPWILKQIAEDQNPFCRTLSQYKNPIMIIGSGMAERSDWEATLYYTKKIAQKFGFVKEGWNGYNVLQRDASRVGGLDIGFLPKKGGMNSNQILANAEVIFLLGADNIEVSKINKNAFVVYIGHHGDKAAYRADVILPAPAFTEKSGTYVNLEGRVQRTAKCVSPLGEARLDWKIITDIAHKLGHKLTNTTAAKLRKEMEKVNSVFKNVDVITQHSFPTEAGKMKDFENDVIHNPISNYYMTNSISRASRTMAQCVRDILGVSEKKKKVA